MACLVIRYIFNTRGRKCADKQESEPQLAAEGPIRFEKEFLVFLNNNISAFKFLLEYINE